MSQFPITLIFADGAARVVHANAGDSIVAAAEEAGLMLLTDCSNGQCGTCTATVVSGGIELGPYDRAVLPDADRKQGSILPCISRVTGSCAVEFPYDISEATSQELEPFKGRVVSVEKIAEETVRLEVEIDEEMAFQSGQYARVRPAGAQQWRSYSMANVPGSRNLVFYTRVVPAGVFSTWLAEHAEPGSILEISHPHGSFFLRDEPRPRLFVAGGTGLAPFLSMLESLASDDSHAGIPTTLLLGVRTDEHFFGLEQLNSLRERVPSLQVHLAAEESTGVDCLTGYATDLIKTLTVDPNTRIYLCGPPPMVEAGRAAAESVGFDRNEILCERFN